MTKVPAKPVRRCGTCEYEPEWFEVPVFRPERSTIKRGRCNYPVGKREIRALKFPHGALITMPMIDEPNEKHNCPAWRPKECAEKK